MGVGVGKLFMFVASFRLLVASCSLSVYASKYHEGCDYDHGSRSKESGCSYSENRGQVMGGREGPGWSR